MTFSGSPRRARKASALAALRAIFAQGRISRAELARRLDVNRSSSGSIIAELMARGLVREVAAEAPKPGRAGRPGVLVELVPEGACFVGVEIGVEHITALRMDLATDVIGVDVVAFDARSTPVADAVRRAVELAFGGLSAEERDRCEGFGLSAPVQMDLHGTIRAAPLLGWQDVDLARLTREALPCGTPSLVENDANAFAIGEAYKEPECRQGVGLFLVIESGVGGGVVIDGRLFRGGYGLAGEIGHLPLPGGGELEEAIGLGRLLERHRATSAAPAAALADLLSEVRDRAPAAVAIAEDWARDLAFALVQACRIIDPDRIVLGGSVAALFPLVAARVAFHMEALQRVSFPRPEILVRPAAETGAAFGAACMMHQRFLSQDHDLLAREFGQQRRSATQSGAGNQGDIRR